VYAASAGIEPAQTQHGREAEDEEGTEDQASQWCLTLPAPDEEPEDPGRQHGHQNCRNRRPRQRLGEGGEADHASCRKHTHQDCGKKDDQYAADWPATWSAA
jgi:hypothetical protein